MLQRVNVLQVDNVRINFNTRVERFAISSNGEWISIGLTAFDLINTLSKSKNDFNKLIIHQNGSSIEVIKLMTNFLLTFVSGTVHSSIILTSGVMSKIDQDYQRIMELVTSERAKSDKSSLVKKRKNFTSEQGE